MVSKLDEKMERMFEEHAAFWKYSGVPGVFCGYVDSVPIFMTEEPDVDDEFWPWR